MFDPVEAIKFGWGVAKKKWAFFLGLMFIQNIITSIPKYYAMSTGVSERQLVNNHDAIYLLLSGVAFFLGLLMGVGYVKIILKLLNNKKAEFSDLFVKDITLISKAFVAEFLAMIIIGLGFILLIIPGLILAARYSLIPYFVIDKNMGPIEAMKASWGATRGNVMNLFFLGFLSFGVALLGIIALFIGLIWAIPTVTMAQAYAYKKLSSKV